MVSNMANEKVIDTFSDYMNDDTRVSPVERERINFEIALIGKMIEAREAKGLSQRELADISGVKQPAIARLEGMKATPQIDTLFKVLHPLGYTIEIVPLANRAD
jgi:DNA-binding XRE family transcriptional regulator